MYRTIRDVVETLRAAKERKLGCNLLIGAGCSVKAGIPTAAGFVEKIRGWRQHEYEAAAEKTYPHCMAELAEGDRRDLIRDAIKDAKLNWAHVAIAQLIQQEFVTHVLTTNFDPLVVRACALLGFYPAVYDLAGSREFNKDAVSTPAVFHLHGQHDGFVLLHTVEECKQHARRLRPVFDYAGSGRPWVVVGYSGLCDPVFEHLAKMRRFDRRFYWVGHKDAEPAEHVRKGLLDRGKDAYFVQGFDADDFFVELAQGLDSFPPDLIGTPFSYLDKLLEGLTVYTIPGQNAEIDVTDFARGKIRLAIGEYEAGPRAARAEFYLLKGDYDRVAAMRPPDGEAMSPSLASLVSWAYVMQGNTMADEAKTKSGDEAAGLYEQAGQKYEAALQIKPDKHEALYNWGNALSARARTKAGEEADRLYEQADQKYDAALQIQPEDHEALNNWGIALSDQANTKAGEEADALYEQAGQKYEAALQIQPDKHEALYNWGNALLEQARTKAEKEADRLYEQAGQKYEAALQIKPDEHEALYNWGNALLDQANTKAGEEADALYEQAGQKYEAALQIRPDDHEVLCNWGGALLDQAKTKAAEEASRLFAAARDRCCQAEALLRGSGAYNLACIAALQGAEAECRQWLETCEQAGTLPDAEWLAQDHDLDGMRDRDWFRDLLARCRAPE